MFWASKQGQSFFSKYSIYTEYSKLVLFCIFCLYEINRFKIEFLIFQKNRSDLNFNRIIDYNYSMWGLN